MKTDKVQFTEAQAIEMLQCLYETASEDFPLAITILKREGYILKNPVEVWEEVYQELNADPMIKVRWVEQANDAIKYLKSKGAGD